MIENQGTFRQTASWHITAHGIEALRVAGYYPYLTPGAVNSRLNDSTGG